MAQSSLPSLYGGEGGLTRYLEEILRFPMLQPQQEYMLAKRYHEHDDPDAAHQLVTSHLRLVAKIAMGYRGYGLPIGEVTKASLREREARQQVHLRPYADLADLDVVQVLTGGSRG